MDWQEKCLWYDPAKLDNRLHTVTKKVIKLIKQAMENWKSKLTAERKNFLVDARSQLLFVIVMMSLIHILRKCIRGDKFTKKKFTTECTRTTTRCLLKWKRMRDFNPNNKSRYRNGIWHRKCQIPFLYPDVCAIPIMRSEKRQITEGIQLPGKKGIRTHVKKGKLRVLWNCESRLNQINGRNKKRVTQTNEKTTRKQALCQESQLRDKYLYCTP